MPLQLKNNERIDLDATYMSLPLAIIVCNVDSIIFKLQKEGKILEGCGFYPKSQSN